MTSVKRLFEMAKFLGIEDQAAMDFVVSQQKVECNEQKAQRLANKELAEAEQNWLKNRLERLKSHRKTDHKS